MSSWTAWNVEPDDNLEDDVDNTREIQLEEAFKLYQNALKLHAQGPQYYEQAGEAYDLLFKSEVFKYPESLIDLTDPTEGLELDYTLDAMSVGPSDDSPSTLPQILYLAYKNHGQFIMDCLKHQVRSGKSKSRSELLPKARLALEQFTQAIARDESDTELWRRAARIGMFVGSLAIARYCLESAVEVDDDPTLGEVDPANLEEGFAGIQLKEHLEVLSDTVALSHPIMLPYMTKQPSERLRKYMDPYPFLPELPGDQTGKDESSGDVKNRLAIELRDRSWEALAEGLLQLSESNDGSSAGITINIPDADADAEMVDAVIPDQPLPEPSSSSSEIPTPADESVPLQKEDANPPLETVPEPVDTPVEQESPSTTRKRSHSAAGMQEPTEEDAGTQKRSKRIRNRESTLVAELTPLDPNAQFKEQLDELSQGDKWMFTFAGSKLEKFGVTELGQFDDLQAVVAVETGSERRDNMGSNTVIKDLQGILSNWDDAKADAYLSGNGMDILGVSGRGAQAGLAAFLEHSKPDSQKLATQLSRDEPMGLLSLVKTINSDWLPLEDVAYLFFKAFRPNYRSCLWSESLKLKLIQLMTRFNSAVYDRLRSEYERFPTQESDLSNVEALEEFAQMMFELHLDVYASITNPSSAVGYGVRTEQKHSLNRWAHLVSDIVQSRPRKVDDELTFRYLWASVLLASMAEGTSQEHIVLCWTDLQAFLQQSGDPKIEIQNNAAMSEISASAADREISRLTTMDFFLSLFKADKLDKGDKTESLNIIEALEPVLDPSSCEVAGSKSSDGVNEEGGNLKLLEADNAVIPPMLRDMRKFLDRGSTSLRLFLWQRLREAYEHIKYTTKVFSCYLKSIEIIVSDLHSPTYAEAPAAARQQQLLTQLKALDDLLVKALTLALNDQTAFDIVDDAHIKSSMKAVAQLARMLHSTALFEDKIRVGMISIPRSAEKASFRFNSFLVRMAEMQIRTWALLYTLLKEGMSQNKDIFTTIDNDLADYLAVVHYPLGLRKCCRYSNKIFLKMMKVEMLRFKHVEKWEDYLGQVLYDLYGIRLGVGVFELMEHGCEIEALDRRTAMTLSDQVITLANRMSMKDLLKSELRPTIEKMQQAIGANRATPQMVHNLRNINDYLKRTLNPRYLAQALKGQVQIDTVRAISPESPIAEREWYFLLGMIHLSKFRSQKRIAAGATDDLKVASSFFRLQLQFTPDHWESWYRLAQCYDAELEEEILWSADKLNMERAPLNQLQKHSIHSYTMALSTAMRNADASFETASRMSSMFHDFGFRIYATSRDPFNMEPFHQDENAKFFSGNQGMYTRPPHAELTRARAWKFAARLFRHSLVEQPDSWMGHYMLGKCLWKLRRRIDQGIPEEDRPPIPKIIETFMKAIQTVPKPRDSRSEPVLEPHYKLVSIMHKLVKFEGIDMQEAADTLQRQPFAVRKGEVVEIPDMEAWDSFIMESVRHLGSIDKSKWQHRIISRAAHLLFDGKEPTVETATAARAELKDSIFTKTMVVNVWKPEHERAGRHCVYMENYVKFMVMLLVILDDKTSLESLVKRVRKKQAEYFHFNEVWTDCCLSYCKIIRKAGGIPMNQDEIIKSFPPEDFEEISDALQIWVDDPNTFHPSFNVLREAIELKKLNNNLMKPMPIDDLVSDAYANFLLQVGCNLPRIKRPVPPPLPANGHPRSQGPMSMNNLVSNLDGEIAPSQLSLEETRPRAKAPSRREILRRADLLVNRVHDLPKGPAHNTSRRPSDQSLLAIVRSSDKTTELQAQKQEESGTVEEEAEPDNENEGENEGEDQSSPPGSVHDSADDESDLSDVPDMEEGPEEQDVQGELEEGSRFQHTGGTISEGTSTPANGDA